MSTPTPLPVDPTAEPAVLRWNVYNASGVQVATYSTEAAAAAHCLAWPALYYRSN